MSADQAVWTQSVTHKEVVRFLANQGLTVAEANDSWQFARNHVQAVVHEGSRTGVEDVRYAALLAQIKAEVKVRGKPSGLRREEHNRLVCFRGSMGYQKGVVPVFDFSEKLSALGVQSQPVQKPLFPPKAHLSPTAHLPPTSRPLPAHLRQGPLRKGNKAKREDRKYRGQAGSLYDEMGKMR
ncbi:hypothetical protein B0H16DRAFT_1468644 [Mycena metata]|uniref:Uncharacterized protein n=1 Tax=Mycena metata TaxID=1033252 RepID=A0AAD7MTR8_9AGAR|nr:hypothetical protein B0H16DRAFT_1468644 [Mycena metata]